jgi:hypothetical protein
MKKIKVSLLLLLVPLFIQAQDFILKRNGDELYGFIKSITPSEIHYTDTVKTDSLYKLNKKDVFMVRYQNGVKEIFDEKQVVKQYIAVPQSTPTQKGKLPLTGSIEDRGSNDYFINGKRYSYRVAEKLMLGIGNEDIPELLKIYKTKKYLGNSIVYPSIGFGVIGLIVGVAGLETGSYSLYAISGALLSSFATMQVGNIILKVDSKRKLAMAISMYNNSLNNESK